MYNGSIQKTACSFFVIRFDLLSKCGKRFNQQETLYPCFITRVVDLLIMKREKNY